MEVFGKALTGAFIGKILAAIFIAACTALGFGPEKWVQSMIPWFTPEIARIGFVVLGLTAFLLLYQPWLWFRKYIPLEEAVKKAYEDLSDTDIREIIRRLELPDVLGYFVQAFIINGVRFYGTPPLLTKIEKIPHDKVKAGSFKNGNDLYRNSDDLIYKDCMVNKKDLKRYIKVVREQSKEWKNHVKKAKG